MTVKNSSTNFAQDSSYMAILGVQNCRFHFRKSKSEKANAFKFFGKKADLHSTLTVPEKNSLTKKKKKKTRCEKYIYLVM